MSADGGGLERSSKARRLISAAALGVLLIVGNGVLPGVASADGPPPAQDLLGGLLQGVVAPVDGVVQGTLNATGLDGTVQLDLTSDDESLLDISAGVSAPDGAQILDFEADLHSPTGSLAQLDTDISLLDGTLNDPLLDTALEIAVGGPEGLASVGADVAGAGGELLDMSLEVGIATGDGLVTVDANVSVADGALLDVVVDASVADDHGLLTAKVGASALGGELLDVTAELELIGDLLAALGVRLDTILGGGAAGPSAAIGAVPGAQAGPTESTSHTAVPASTHSAKPAAQPSPRPVGSRSATGVPAPRAVERAPLSPSTPDGPAIGRLAGLLATGGGSRLVRPAAPTSHSVVDMLGGALAPPLTPTFSNSHETLAVLAAAAALAAAAVFLKGRPGLLVVPASRLCLAPVTPG